MNHDLRFMDLNCSVCKVILILSFCSVSWAPFLYFFKEEFSGSVLLFTLQKDALVINYYSDVLHTL